jgi:hypothetical protein
MCVYIYICWIVYLYLKHFCTVQTHSYRNKMLIDILQTFSGNINVHFMHGYLRLMSSVYATLLSDIRLYCLATWLSDSFGFVSTVAALSRTNSGRSLKNSDFNVFWLCIRNEWTSFFSPNAENSFRGVGKFQYFSKVMSNLNEGWTSS